MDMAHGQTAVADVPKSPRHHYPLMDYDPVPLPDVKLSPRPRIWFNAAEIPGLRLRCQTTLKGDLDQQRREVEGDKAKNGAGILAFDLAFLYQMTGDATYAKRAIAIARQAKPFEYYSWHATGHPMGGLYLGQAEPLACVYDWCYDQMGEADRLSIGQVIREQLAHGPYHATFHEPWYMCAWLSQILALHGAGIDDKFAEEHLKAYNRAIHQFAWIADSIHADGAIGDYGYQYMYFMLWPEMWMRATGENLFKTCGFYRTQPEYLLHTIRGEGKWLPGDGDAGFDGFGARSIFHFYGWRNNNPYARGLASEMAKNWNAWPNSGSGLNRPWMSILWHGDGGEMNPLRELPLVKLFPINQVAILRSGWNLGSNSIDTIAAFYCRPWEGHCHRNVGHFTIHRGQDQLAQDGGIYAWTNCDYHDNYFTATVAHNCVLIYDPQEPPLGAVGYGNVSANDGGQVHGDAGYYGRMGGGSFRGTISNFTDGPRFTYLFADLSPAYSAFKAIRVARAFFFLKPSTYVVCDWVRSVKPDSTKRWVLNTATQPAVEGEEKVLAGTSDAGIVEAPGARRATVSRGASKLTVQVLAPEHSLIRRIGGEGYAAWVDGKNREVPASIPLDAGKRERLKKAAQWRLEIDPVEQTTDTVFLHVLDATAIDAAPLDPALLVKRGEAVGTALKRGDASIEVLFYPDGRASVDGQMIGKALEPLKPLVTRK